MQRVRVALSRLVAGERRLEGDAAHYLTRVHRLGNGAPFTAFDPEARLEARGEILAVERHAVTCRLGAPEPARDVPALDVTLVQCLGKGDKLDLVVRSATALGVRSIVVAESERSVARLEPARSAQRAERWRAVALDAARQCGRGDVPELHEPRALAAVLAELRTRDVKKLCLEPGAMTPFGAALGPRPERPAAPGAEGRAIVLLVGPEGGLTDDELALASEAGFVRVRLGALVLRTELAGAAALAALLAWSDS